MIHSKRNRLPFLATGLAVAIGFMSTAQGEDKSPLVTPSDKTTTSSSAKQVTMTGKVVNLHQFMTGQMSSNSSIDRPGSSDRITPTDRTNPSGTTPTDRTKPGDSTTTPGDKSLHGDKHQQTSNMSNEVMGLETSTGLVLICFKDAPGVLAVPRDNDAPTTTPGITPSPTEPRTPKTPTTPSTPNTSTTRDNDSNNSRNQDSSRWQDKQVEVSGSMYEKNGIKFLVVTKVTASTDTTTTKPGTTNPRE